MVDGSSRMRVIIMTDVVYSHFPSHHLFCEVENPPTLSLRYRRALRSGAKPCHNPSLPLILETFILPSASLFLLR